MTSDVSVTARIPSELRERLDHLAKNTDRSRAWHIVRALEAYLAETEQLVAGDLEGIQALETGDVVPGEEVGRMIRELIAANKVA
jgi:predicted transcriptional regulator